MCFLEFLPFTPLLSFYFIYIMTNDTILIKADVGPYKAYTCVVAYATKSSRDFGCRWDEATGHDPIVILVFGVVLKDCQTIGPLGRCFL